MKIKKAGRAVLNVMRISILLVAFSSCLDFISAQRDASPGDQAVFANPDVKSVAIIGMIRPWITNSCYGIDIVQAQAQGEALLLTFFPNLQKRLEFQPISQYSNRMITSAVDQLPSTRTKMPMNP